MIIEIAEQTAALHFISQIQVEHVKSLLFALAFRAILVGL